MSNSKMRFGDLLRRFYGDLVIVYESEDDGPHIFNALCGTWYGAEIFLDREVTRIICAKKDCIKVVLEKAEVALLDNGDTTWVK